MLHIKHIKPVKKSGEDEVVVSEDRARYMSEGIIVLPPKRAKMNKKIEKAVLASLRQAVAIHGGTARPAKKYTLAYTARRLPATPAPRFTAARIVELRQSMRCSQPAFASLLNVSAPTVRAWEQNQRQPHGAAARLLQVIAAKPNVIRTVVFAPLGRARTAAAR